MVRKHLGSTIMINCCFCRKYPGTTIVTDSVTSNGLTEFIEGLGGKHFRYRRGYKNVIGKGVELNEQARPHRAHDGDQACTALLLCGFGSWGCCAACLSCLCQYG